MSYRSLWSTFSLLNTDRVQLNKSWKYDDITSLFYRLYYIEDGGGALSNVQDSVRLEKGYLYLVPSFTTCTYICDGYLDQYYISFVEDASNGSSMFLGNNRILKMIAGREEVRLVKNILRLNPGRGLHLSHNPAVYERKAVLDSYRQANYDMAAPAFIETCGILLQLVARFMALEEFVSKEKIPVHSKISDALQFIQANLGETLTVELLARQANQHPDHFSRLFYSNTGMRPLAYIQLKRIQRACLLMVTTSMMLHEIADQTGFESLSYFCRIFKKVTGQTPASYRNLDPM